MSSFRFRLVHTSVLVLLVVANFFKWLFFGSLTPHEIASVREKAGHTAWEFVFGFLVFYNSTGNFLDIYSELFKFAGLFLCVWLVKGFHYLTAERVHSVSQTVQVSEIGETAQNNQEGQTAYNIQEGQTTQNILDGQTTQNIQDGQTAQNTQNGICQHNQNLHRKFLLLRLGLAIVCLNVADVLLIYRYWHDVIFQNYVKHNVLMTIFGFEIMNLFPMILSTSLQFGLNTYELLAISPASSTWKEWKLRNVRTIFMAEFVFNLVRLLMSLVFSLLFLYYYTFPVHMLPAAYNSLKIAVLKTRIYVNFRKRELLLEKLQKPEVPPADKCIICYDELEVADDVRVVPGCGHPFHFECIQMWLDYLSSCPVCREKI